MQASCFRELFAVAGGGFTPAPTGSFYARAAPRLKEKARRSSSALPFWLFLGPRRREDLLDLLDAPGEGQRRHLEVGVVADAAVFPLEELRDPAQFRQLVLQAAQVLL